MSHSSLPDEVEIDSILSDHMRAYAEKHGYTPVPADDPSRTTSVSYRLERPNTFPESCAVRAVCVQFS